MSTETRNFTWTISAGEDLDDSSDRYRAVALDDGKIASNGLEAGGILLFGGKENEHLTLGYAGVLHFLAGADISKGQRLTVDEHGCFIPATVGSYIVGRCLDTSVQAGKLGHGAFNFATIAYMSESEDGTS